MIRIARFIGIAVLTLVAVLSSGRPAHAELPPFPAGQACNNFDLKVDGFVVPEPKEFKDKNGNVVRTLVAGKGSALTFTNLGTGATLSLKSNGSVTHTTFNPDGTQTVVATGHNVIILFPTDVPAGPSTTLYVGRVVYTVDPSTGVFTLQKTSGKTIDICAALS
jgi:hypothetical protein